MFMPSINCSNTLVNDPVICHFPNRSQKKKFYVVTCLTLTSSELRQFPWSCLLWLLDGINITVGLVYWPEFWTNTVIFLDRLYVKQGVYRLFFYKHRVSS